MVNFWLRVGDKVYNPTNKKTGKVIMADNLNTSYAIEFDGKISIYGEHNLGNLKLVADK